MRKLLWVPCILAFLIVPRPCEAQLATQVLNLSGRPTKDAQEAASQHKPLRVRSTLFVPTETQVVRQTANPS